MDLVFGQDDAVAEWAGVRLGVTFQRPFVAIGIARGGAAIGAAVFNEYYRGGNIELTFVGDGALTRRVQRALAQYAFGQLAVSRITIRTAYRNTKVRKLLGRKGRFEFEGVQKRFYGPDRGDDALVYVLPREKAGKWLETTE